MFSNSIQLNGLRKERDRILSKTEMGMEFF